MSRFTIRCTPLTLELRTRFTIAHGSRTTTPSLLVELERDGVVGYGEAAMPPYLGETQETAQALLARIDLAAIDDPFATRDVLAAVDRLADGNTAAKAAFDLALHDWQGKVLGQPHWRLCGLTPTDAPPTSYTIGIGDPDDVAARAADAAKRFRSLKIKLGSQHDRDMIDAIRDATDAPLRVDVNQGWHDREHARREIAWLADRGVELVEQAMPVDRRDDAAWLRRHSALPLFADEAVQRLGDLRNVLGAYDGVNVKLMKCTGLREARDLIAAARGLGLSVMLGCMTETSCAIAAAAQLASLCDHTDLDGALLVANDPFEPLPLVDGCVVPNDAPGLGVTLAGAPG